MIGRRTRRWNAARAAGRRQVAEKCFTTRDAGCYVLVRHARAGPECGFGGRAFLEYPPESAGTLILLIETGALLSIGLNLTALFFGGRPEVGTGESRECDP